MNHRTYRLVFSRLRGMLVAVEETAAATGKGHGEISATRHPQMEASHTSRFALRSIVLAALVLLGAVPAVTVAQIVAAPGSGAQVMSTQNGLPQVNIARPSGAGVSVNSYSQFDVQRPGAILNNSPTIVQTQQAGMINGNPNFAAGQSAKIIVNQVKSSAASQINGYLEVAGQRAEVVIANGSGISVNGGGFINTSRAILTTGTPNYGADGNLAGFNVTGGNITVQGAGLNAGNVDQVDLIARAVQANAAIYVKNLNVITGANSVDHDTLNATPIVGSGPAPGVSIDVSNLGGMYANRIVLVGTENGVGVSTKGVLAAQAGDLTLTTAGKLVLAGQTSTSGNIAISAHDGIDNSGTTYAQQSVSANTSGALTSSGTLAAQQNTTATASSIVSTGTLGAGINSDGSIAPGGELNLSASGALTATGRNAAGGSATVEGASVNLAGSSTSAKGNLTLIATAGDLNNSGATTTAGGTLTASAAGTLTNDNGVLSSGAAQTVNAGALSNRSGQMVAGGALVENVAGAVSNAGGTMQAAGAFTASAGPFDNTAGRVASLNADGLSLSAAGLLNNGAGGTGVGAIGGNGNVTVQAGQIANAGSISAVQNLIAAAVQALFNSGTLAANVNVNASAGTTLSNANTIAAGRQAFISAATFDNSGGSASADQFTLAATNLVNHGGAITQTGSGVTTVNVAGTLDNVGGTLQTNSSNLALGPATLVNDNGTISSSGSGTLSVKVASLSNNGGTIATNGALTIDGGPNGGAVSNRGGTLAGQWSAALNVGSLDNSAGGYIGAQNVSVKDAGVLSNAGGTIQANDTLALSAQSVANDGGTIANGGSGATTVNAAGALTNTNNGLIGGNGDVSVTGASIDNSGGAITAAGATSVQSGSTLGNRAGMIQGTGNVTASAQGALDNTGGQIEADGANATMQVSGASLDNTNGRIANTGSGATTISAAAITNSNAGGVAGAGTIGGNGDLALNAQTLSSTGGAQIVSGHDLTLSIGQLADNTNATLSGAHNVTLNGPNAAIINAGGSIHGNGAIALDAASLDNTSGRIGNDTGSGGGIAIAAGTLANQNGAIGSDQDLSVTTNRLTGDGRIIAGNDGVVTVNGDYTLDGANRIQANHDLSFTTAGSFTNQGTLGAVNALTVNAANVDNQAGADLNSTNTTVNAAGWIANAGRIEGDSVTTHSASLTNTATVVGNTVTLNAGSIANTGTAAAIAAASQLNLYSPGDISNTGGANIFSLGDVNIAANDTRDANGLLANRSNSVTNDQSTIEAQGNIEVAAQTLTNTRPAPTVETVTTGVDTLHQTKRDKYMACATGNSDKGYCTQAMWDNGYIAPVSSTFAVSQIVTEQVGSNATDRMLVVNVNGQNKTIYYNTVTTNPDNTITVSYWDGYDPNVNYDPATEYASRNDAHKGYQRVEIARDTTTTTQQDQVSGPQAQQAQLIAGANLTLANVGTVNNAYSAIAAGSAIAIGSDAYGGTVVNNTGQTLYQYQKQDIVSTYAWNEDISRDVGTVVEPSIVLSPVAIGGTGGTIIANNAVQINATDINNTNVAAANSATGATGGTLGANGTVGGVTGGGAQTVNLATGQTQTINAPQSIAGPTGALNITLPSGGLYTFNTSPGASYLVVTDPRLTSYTSFISSDYMLGALGLDPSKIIKRLGDGAYEEQLVRNQITQLTGRVYLQGYTSNEDEYRALMTRGVNVAQQFNLEPGMALTAAQMDALTSDIVWLVSQTVTLPDGSMQQVLAPVVYLAHAHANDLQPTGALITADDVEIHATGSATNSGVIKGGTQTVISATNILNRGGTIGSSGENGTTVVSATNDLVNASGRIMGNRVAVLAGHNIVNTTLVDAVGVSSTAGNSRVSQTLLGAQGTIASTGDMVIAAGNDLLVHGANIAAGGNAQIAAGHDISVDTVQADTLQSVTKNANHHWEASGTVNETSAITSGGSLAMQSGNDMTFKGATVAAGGDMAVVAGGNLTATTVTNTATYNNVATDDKTRKQTDRSYDEQAVGTTFTAGGSGTLAALGADASKGNVTLTGSSLSTGTGAANIVATGNVNINEAREEHDSYTATESKRGSTFHGSTTDTSQASQANIGVASTVSGDSVNIRAGKDLTVKGATVAGTNDVNLAAGGNVSITTSQDTQTTSSYYQKHESGFGTGGGIGISVGSQTQTNTAGTSQVTNTGSTIGSLNGNLNIVAGNDLHVTGSDLIAAKNVTGTGANVTIDSATDTYHHDDKQTVSKSGFTLAIKAPVIDAISNTVGEAHAASHSQDDRAAALHGMAAASGAVDAAGAAAGLVGALASGGTPEAKIELSYGSSHSENTYSEDSRTNRGSNVTAGGTAAFVATGNGASGNGAGSGNVTIAGSNVNANDVILAAKNQVNLVNTTDTDSTRSTNQSSSASVGISYGTQGFGVSASMSRAHGNANSDTAMQNNTHVTAANTATIISGGDTNVIGANVNGRQVNADVGGNLNLASVQDTMTSAAHQESTGGGFAISQGGGSASFSHTNANASGSYAGVNEQAGIHAGDGGFHVSVTGNTDLKGAVIASDADASKNTLATGTLTYSDIQNSSSYNAHSGGIGGGVTTGDGGTNYGTHGPASTSNGPNAGGPAPMLSQNDNGSDSATTKSGISAGTISVTDVGHQTQGIASLNRDTSNTNGMVAKLPDVNNLLDRQSDMMAAAGAAGEAVSRRIGDYADRKARDAGGDGGGWQEGGTNRAIMQAAGAALVTGLAGGNALGGAAGAGIASIAAGNLNKMSDAIADSDPTGNANMNQALGNIVANAIATGAGAAVGGNAGAFSGYNVDRFNRMLHPDEKKLIHDLANGDADKEHRLEAAGCALVHCAAEFAPGTAEYARYSALEQEGAGYTPERAQLQNYNGRSVSLAGYGGMVRQSSGGLFQYPVADSTADNKAMRAAMEAQRPGSVDYLTVEGGGLGVGGALTVNLHNGNVYLSASGSVPVVPSASIVGGMVASNPGLPAGQKGSNTDDFLAGASAGGGACAFGVCGGVNHGIGGDTAFEIGVGAGGITKALNPSAYGGTGYGNRIGKLPAY
ncbi:hemagglutinin repeat-containing protein [Burkholderia sp. WSM2230]|uniref:hemagglutinin repeat-containing protein n=1 Tax=Burkholderia sp. WSM2230 TaxID=944435 RepID=UPI0004700A90|nr:hemagglutinin repeat-containing protein [Burkholderia sp. WSM2230]